MMCVSFILCLLSCGGASVLASRACIGTAARQKPRPTGLLLFVLLICFWFTKEKRCAREQRGTAKSRTEKIHARQKFFLVGNAVNAGDGIKCLDHHTGFGPATIGAGG